MPRTRTDYAVLNIAAGLGGYVLNTILGYVCRMIFVRCLSAEYLGISGLFSNILSMLSVAELGIGTAIGYALYRPLAERNEEKMASLMRFYGRAYRLIGAAVGAMGILLLPFLDFIIQDAPTIGESLYLIYGVYLFNTVGSYFLSYRGTLLSANQKNFVILAVSSIASFVQNLLQIGILLSTRAYMPYLFAQTVCVLASNLSIHIYTQKKYPYISGREIKPLERAEKRSLFVNIKALTINKLSAILVGNTDNIVITFFNGLVTTGIASNYVLLTNVLTSLITQLYGGVTASVGNFNATESADKRHGLFLALNLSNFWIYGWCAIGIALLSSDIVALCFGREYVLEQRIPLILAVNFYMIGMNNTVYIYKSTMGLFRHGQYLILLTALLNLSLDLILGKIWGLFGIYIATAIARLLTNIWYEPFALYRYGLKRNPLEYLKRYMAFTGILLLAGALCFWLCSLCSFMPLPRLMAKFAICCIVPNAIFGLCFHKRKEFAYLLEVAGRIKQKLCLLAKKH